MIRFNQVNKQFSTNSFGAVDLSFLIEPGEFLILTGKSGAGKTTLMRLITKEYTPDSGEILVEDLNLNELPFSRVHELRRKIGVVFQDYRLLPELNVWENIALPLSIVGQPDSEIEERVTDLLRLIQLPEKAVLFPSQLSGGEAQRVSIARALAVGPSVIFADEPTGNLDKETSESIGRLLKKINELGTTVIFATHDPIILDYFAKERRIHLEDGKLMKDTKPSKTQAKSKPAEDEETESDVGRKEKENAKEKSDERPEPESEETSISELKMTSPTKPGLFGKIFNKFSKSHPVVETESLDDDLPLTDDYSENDSKSHKDTKTKKHSSKSNKKDK